MQWILIPFGWLFIVAMFIAIVMPYLRGKGELVSPWTLFLLGAANFIGFSSIQSGNAIEHYESYTDASYLWFIAGALVYFVAAFMAFYWVKFPRKLAKRTFRKWVTDDRTSVLVVLLCFCAVLSLGSVIYPNVQFIGQITSIMGQAAGPLALTLALIALVRQPYNPAVIIIFVVVLALTLSVAMSVGIGRRSLLGTLMAFPIVAYWLWARRGSAVKNVVVASVGATVIFLIMSSYSAIRFRESLNESALTRGVNAMKMLPAAILGKNRTGVLGADTTEVSLLAINHFGKEAPHEPFFTLYYVLVNPLPRAFWPNKPLALGERLPRESGYLSRVHGYVNWGPGIVGHGFHEGGLYILLIYGILTGIGFRYADDLLSRQPDNPILLGTFAAASGQIVAFVRGEVGLFIVLIIGACLTGFVVNVIGRIVFGTGRVYPRPGEEEAMSTPEGGVYYPADPEGLFIAPSAREWRL